MKHIFTFILLTIFISSYGQFVNKGIVSVDDGTVVYSGINYQNYVTPDPGTITFKAGGNSEFVLNAGFDNRTGTLTMNDNVLKFGNGHPTNSAGNYNLFFNDFTSATDQGSFVDVVQFVEFNKVSGTLTADATSGGQLGITGTFTTGGTGTLEAQDHIALVSTSIANTAIVPEGTGTPTINGMRVQRYIPAARAWRFLANPAIPGGSNTIHSDWQESATIGPLAATTDNPHSGYGTHITGGTVANGFDQNDSDLPSIYRFDNATGAYVVPANTTTASLADNSGYYILVRGDRSVNLSLNDFGNSPTTILQTTGSLRVSDKTFSTATATDGWVLVGNPYQAPVDMNEVLSNGVTNIDTNNMWVWDPQTGTDPNRGQFVTLDPSCTTCPVTVPGSSVTNILQPGQAVFLQATTGGSPVTITFQENDKHTDLTEVFSNEIKPVIDGWLRFGLYQPTAKPFEETAKDGFILKFDKTFSNTVTREDSPKSFAHYENMALLSNNAYLSKNARQLPTDMSENIPLYLENLRNGTYNFSVELEGFTGKLPNGIILWDKYENTYTQLADQQIIPFNVDVSIPESIATDRFAFVFENQTLGIEDNVLEGVTLYPNPVISDRLSIKFNNAASEDTQVEIFSQLGKLVYRNDYNNNGSEIEVDNLDFLSSGVYLLKVKQDRLEKTFKIIKK